MNFLQLAQRLARECGVNGAISNVLGQTGEQGRCVDWIADSWLELQGDKKWQWLWEQPTLSLLAGQDRIATDLPPERWVKKATYLPIIGSDNGDRFLDYLPWEDFTLTYPRIYTQNGVTAWTIAPDNTMRFNAIVSPAVDTDVVVQRYKLPVPLAANTDVPAMPADLHMILVYEAMVRYADFDEAGTQRTTAIDKLARLKRTLYKRCLAEEFRMGVPLVDML